MAKKKTKINSAGYEQPVNEKSQYQSYNSDNLDIEDNSYISEIKRYRHNTKYTQIIADDIISQRGAQSGALDVEGKDGERAQKHANMMYETFRNIKSDVPKIAASTGYSEQEIQRVKNHLFFNEYELADGKHKFYPDFYQAQSWDRLRKGEPIEIDFIMIEHELIEESLMRNGINYDDAHNTANETANYQQAIKEIKYGQVKKKGN
ncbi:MAG: hypothetical protein K2K85_03675 [Clostridia bacterium]|nr:hypothetical protein [Clostridia bacterium]